MQRAEVLAQSVALARDLVNTPPGDLSPADLAERARAEAAEVGVGAEIWDEDALAEQGFGGILGVGKGSSPAAAAGPADLAARRARPARSRWSARASPSTPAACR